MDVLEYVEYVLVPGSLPSSDLHQRSSRTGLNLALALFHHGTMTKTRMSPPFLALLINTIPLRSLAWFLLLLALAGCTHSPAPPEDAPHPLVGRIYDTLTNRELEQAEFDARLGTAQVIYLGEAHDEPAHHEVQIDVLRRMVRAGRRPAVGFEIFAAGQTNMLEEYLQHTGDANEWLRNAAGWSVAGDPHWGYYGVLLQYARSGELELFGMDLDRTLRRRITSVGAAGLTVLEQLQLRPTQFQDAVYRDVMFEQLKASHCGYGDEAFIGRLYDTWLARNDSMAAAIATSLDADPSRPVVVILGAGHTGYGMGVAERVAHRRPGTRQLNIGLRSVRPEATQPADYYDDRPPKARRYPATHEIIWFTRWTTSRLTDEERCARAFDTPVQPSN